MESNLTSGERMNSRDTDDEELVSNRDSDSFVPTFNVSIRPFFSPSPFSMKPLSKENNVNEGARNLFEKVYPKLQSSKCLYLSSKSQMVLKICDVCETQSYLSSCKDKTCCKCKNKFCYVDKSAGIGLEPVRNTPRRIVHILDSSKVFRKYTDMTANLTEHEKSFFHLSSDFNTQNESLQTMLRVRNSSIDSFTCAYCQGTVEKGENWITFKNCKTKIEHRMDQTCGTLLFLFTIPGTTGCYFCNVDDPKVLNCKDISKKPRFDDECFSDNQSESSVSTFKVRSTLLRPSPRIRKKTLETTFPYSSRLWTPSPYKAKKDLAPINKGPVDSMRMAFHPFCVPHFD